MTFKGLSALVKIRDCPKCGKKMGQFLQVFLPNPEVIIGENEVFNISVKYEMDGKVARLQAESIIKFKLQKLIPPQDIFGSTHSDLGDRGLVKKIIHNTAVKIGEDWYLLAALPRSSITN
jgi:hypothetical protein